VFGWRKAAREGRLALPAENDRSVMNFAPVVITEASPRARQRSSPPNTPDAGAIEIEAMGVAVRIGGSADVVLVEAIVRALRA
jgi:hypothetical protein